MSRIIAITSGKGGVGKTNVSVNLALYLAGEGYRTCLFDADMGLANIDILLGIYPEWTLADVILEKKKLGDIIIRDYMGIDIIPGSSGVQRMADPRPEETDLMVKELSGLTGYDFLIVDTSAGASKNVISFCMAASEIILIITPEPTSLTDAYSLLKILSLNGFTNSVMVAVNQCRDLEVSNRVFSKFKAAVEKFLSLRILPAGTILSDEMVSEAVKKQKPLVNLFPDSLAAKGIKNIGRRLLKREKNEFIEYDLNDFWKRCFRFFSSALRLRPDRGGKAQAPDTVREAPGGVTDGSGPMQAEPATAGMALSSVLERLAVGVSTISSELQSIREIMERNEGIKNTGHQPSNRGDYLGPDKY